MKIRHLCLLATLCTPVLSHALDETPLSMVFEIVRPGTSTNANIPNTKPESSPLPSLRHCRVGPRKLEDLRPSKESAGGMVMLLEGPVWAVPLGAVSVRSGDGMAWLRGAVASLAAAGWAAPEAAPPDGVDIALRMAQTWVGGMNIHSHVVLQASFPGAGTRETRRYHGFASKLNGYGANAEFMTTLNMGMLDALQQFAQDLQRACKGESLQAAQGAATR